MITLRPFMRTLFVNGVYQHYLTVSVSCIQDIQEMTIQIALPECTRVTSRPKGKFDSGVLSLRIRRPEITNFIVEFHTGQPVPLLVLNYHAISNRTRFFLVPWVKVWSRNTNPEKWIIYSSTFQITQFVKPLVYDPKLFLDSQQEMK